MSLALLLSNFACMGSRGDLTSLPRMQAGQLVWLQKQSLLGQSGDLIAEVSQSERLWRPTIQSNRELVFLKAAPNWLQIDEKDFTGAVFRSMAREIDDVSGSGFQGIYLGETGERSDIWHERKPENAGLKSPPASMEPASAYGSEEDFTALLALAEDRGLQTGSAILGAGTGLGPDFMLQARNVPGYAGLYAMLPIPRDVWEGLPPAEKAWDCVVLDTDQRLWLEERDLLPHALVRDDYPWSISGAWSATGPVTGVDGISRRWLYRSGIGPEEAILLWQDPSGLARRVFSASIIRTTGLLGQSLAGLSLEPLLGLEAREADDKTGAYGPGLVAIGELSGEIHRYGGWAVETDALPPEFMREVLLAGCDFTRDALTPLLAAWAVLNKNSGPLLRLYKSGGISGPLQRRMARGLKEQEGVRWRLLAALPDGEALLEKFPSAEKDEILPWAGVFARLPVEQRERAATLLLDLRFGLPGPAFFTFGELADPGTLRKSEIAPRWRKLLRERAELELAQGELTEVAGAGSWIGFLNRTSQGYWLTVCNFGPEKTEILIDLSVNFHDVRILGNGDAFLKQPHASARKIRLWVDGLHAGHVFLQ